MQTSPFRARLTQQVEHAFDQDHLRELLKRNALAQETIDSELLKVLQRKQSLQDMVYGLVRNKAKRKGSRNA